MTKLAGFLGADERLQSGLVADQLAVRIKKQPSRTQSYSEADFDRIKVAATRMFRAALLRIEENARHLERWRAGDLPKGSWEWALGEGLDILARTGDLPHTVGPSGQRTLVRHFRRTMGGTSAAVTWQRLFLSRMEATALAVLLMAEFGWNLSVIDGAEVPRASPDPGGDGHPTYRIPLEKLRRGGSRRYETRNVTDDGAASKGRLITQALRVTRFARAIVEELAPGTNLLMVWRARSVDYQRHHGDRPPAVGVFNFGIQSDDARCWAKKQGLAGSPFRRGRRTVNALDRREVGQNSQDTHDRHYVLVDKRVQAEALEVIAAGVEDAAERARKAVLVATLRNAPDDKDVETAAADCHDWNNSPYPAPDGGCGASFLMCLACENARIHPGHHPRLVHLYEVLGGLRSVLGPNTWAADWGDTHARLDDLKDKLGDGLWAQARDRVTVADREIIGLLLTGNLDT
ncbi:hypothetical protein ACU4GG_29180 [Streptomyces nojiriensis]